MPHITLSGGGHFTANDGETILDASRRHEVALPYSCRTGRCSSCKARVTSGITHALHDEPGLDAGEIDAGWILTCVRTALSDVALQAEDLGRFRLAPARTVPCRIHSIERLAHDVVKLLLRLPPNQPFDYRPGQYVEVIGPGGLRRSYSLANAPSADKRLELHVGRVDDGAMSAYWFDTATPNALLRMNGPLGTFFLREAAGLELVFLATGTGIAPIKAMLEGMATLAAAEWPASIAVYWGGRIASDLYWTPPSMDMPCRFVPVLSRADAAWLGRRGHVQQALLADHTSLAHSVVYACGSDAMIRSASAELIAAGLPEHRFFSDAFVCSAAT